MHIPFEKLPPDLQEKVMGYLQTDNFQAAKDLRDQYESDVQDSAHQAGAKGTRPKTDQALDRDKKIFFTT